MFRDMWARTFEYVLHFVGCDTVTVSSNQIIIIIIIIIIMWRDFISGETSNLRRAGKKLTLSK